MANINFYQGWLSDALFWLGVCVAAFGSVLLIAPGYAIRLSKRLNHWVSTESFFHELDKPRYRERFFYRWHKLFGTVLVIASFYILYMMLFQTDIESAAAMMPIFKQKEVNEWLYEALQVFFIIVSIFVIFIGVAVVIRPSALKIIEERANRWVQSEQSLKKLDTEYTIPENILPGNVRLFGCLVMLGGIYIMASVSGLIY